MMMLYRVASDKHDNLVLVLPNTGGISKKFPRGTTLHDAHEWAVNALMDHNTNCGHPNVRNPNDAYPEDDSQ